MWSDDGHRWCTRGETTGGWWRTSISFADLRRKNRSVGRPPAGEGRGDNPVQEPQTREILQRGGHRRPPCMQAQALGKGHTAQPLETRKGSGDLSSQAAPAGNPEIALLWVKSTRGCCDDQGSSRNVSTEQKTKTYFLHSKRTSNP